MKNVGLLRILRLGLVEPRKLNVWQMFQSEDFVESLFISEFANRIDEKFPNFNIIAGVGRKGGFLGSLVSRELEKPFISCNPDWVWKFWEKRRFDRCISKWINGNVLIVDDTVKTGHDYTRSKRIIEDCDANLRVIGEATLVWDDTDKDKPPYTRLFYLFPLSVICNGECPNCLDTDCDASSV